MTKISGDVASEQISLGQHDVLNRPTTVQSDSVQTSFDKNAVKRMSGQVAEKRDLSSKLNVSTLSGDEKQPETLGEFYEKVLKDQPLSEKTEKKLGVYEIRIGKSSKTATLADYRAAYDKTVFDLAGMGDLTKDEREMALGLIGMSDKWNLEMLRQEHAKPGPLRLPIRSSAIDITNRAGQAVLQFKECEAKRVDAAVQHGKDYPTEAVGGFVQPIVNAPVNIANGLSEPFRAGERALFGTSNIPEIPRMTVAERSEYWNRDGRLNINKGAEIVSTVVLGGGAGAKAAGTQAGRLLLGTEAAYNIGAGAAGKDLAQTDEQGNPRQMSNTERALRIGGGLLGARQAIKTEVATPNSITNRVVDKLDDVSKNNRPKPQADAVTPEGIKIKVNADRKIENSAILESRANGFPNQRIPNKNGAWTGEVGNSGWKSTKPEVNAITDRKPVPFKNGYPVFDEWKIGEVRPQKITGRNRIDFKNADEEFARQKGWFKNGQPDRNRVAVLRKEHNLTWHHVEDGKTMQLVPFILNEKISHTGGASLVRQAADIKK